MKLPSSKLGLSLAVIYILAAAYLILTQGLFGESFISIILGLPWTLLLALIEFGGASGVFLYVLILTPMVLNAVILYWIGALIQRLFRK